MPTQPEIRILKTATDLFEAAAAEFAAQASAAVSANGKFTVALSGGSTPRTLYSLLATKPNLPWDKICIFWGDERHVAPDQPESNYRMANEALLSKVPVRPENVFRIHAEEKDAAAAALQYEQTLKDFFHLSAGEFPRFDLIFLGVGPDGHTASLFPGTSALSGNQAPRGRQLGAKIQYRPHHLYFSGTECRGVRDLSAEWSRQSCNPPGSTGEQERRSAVAKGVPGQRQINLDGG